MVIKGKDTPIKVYFIYPNGDELPVDNLPDELSMLDKGTMYIVGEYLYRYRGDLTAATRKYRDEPGNILKMGNRYIISNFDDAPDSVKEIFHIKNCEVDPNAEESLDSIFASYTLNYQMKNNLIADNKRKLFNRGNLFIPELKDTDDALTRIMKIMIVHVGVVLNDHKDEFEKGYSLDNMRSAINGSTARMSITKFLAWCKLLHLDWEFQLEDNGTDVLNPLVEPIMISNKVQLDVECEDEGDPSIFKVPIKEDDDPLKRLVKACIIKKKIRLADYKNKGPTPHLLNNMRSALKRNSRMMFPYFTYWCEMLGVNYILSITNPEDGYTLSVDSYYSPNDYMIDDYGNDDDDYDEDDDVLE